MSEKYSRALYRRDYGQEISTDVDDYGIPRAFLAHMKVSKPVAADSDGMVDGAACTTGAEASPLVITTFLKQPDWPRNIVVVVAADTAGNIAGGNIVVTGKNFAGETITETHAVTADTAATFTGAKAFKSVTSVTVPVQDGADVTVDVGWGTLFGIPYKLSLAGMVLLKLFNNAADSGTVTVDAANLEKNYIALNGTPNGAKDIDLYMIV